MRVAMLAFVLGVYCLLQVVIHNHRFLFVFVCGAFRVISKDLKVFVFLAFNAESESDAAFYAFKVHFTHTPADCKNHLGFINSHWAIVSRI